ncbi:MAG: phosphate ABC transporter permease PstA [Proteobacteria bacterium]|nr:phosphate ABC transporter permease PstA [Pseudomonadota bacterium]
MNSPEPVNTMTTRPSLLEPGKNLKKRYRTDLWFQRIGITAIFLSLAFIALLFFQIISEGYTAFIQTNILLEVEFSEQAFAKENLATADYPGLIKKSLTDTFPEVKSRNGKKLLFSLVSSGAAYKLQEMVEANPKIIGTRQKMWVAAASDVDMLMKNKIDRKAPEENRRLMDNQLAWLDILKSQGRLEKQFNQTFFTTGDSREPELAGILGGVKGTALTLFITLTLAFPIGVAAAIYLEEFAPQNHWTDLIEVNINNLAAVPSIIFGLLGLAIFINFFGLPRSTPIVGGLVLALMALPTIIIAGRASLKSVPPSIREAALGIGASKMQTITHHVLPLAMPGMLTGAIIGMAHALGETAPLLMIGMVAFIVDIPGAITDPAAVLPVQIYLWADSPERGFTEKTSAAIIILLAFLMTMNSLAIYLRKKFEIKW